MFWVKQEYGHVWLYYNGVVIWTLSSDKTYSYLHQISPSNSERLSENNAECFIAITSVK